MSTRTLRLVEDPPPALARGPVQGGRMKVAFTTNDLKTVNAHFAGARTLSVWEVGAEDAAFVEAIQFDTVGTEDGAHTDDGEARIRARVKALDGVALLFVKAIGGPAAAKVVRANVHPIKLPDDEAITDVIARVQGMMTAPPPWLRKIMLASTGNAADDLAFLDDDD